MSVVPDKYRGSKEYLLVYMELMQAARHRGTVTYQEIAKIVGLPLSGNYMGAEVGHLVGEISEDEVSHGRPMLSAIVVSAAGAPGSGFFDLAQWLGKLENDTEEGRPGFWEAERTAVYATWRTPLK